MANANFDSLLTTTLANYKKRMTDNIFSARPLFWWLTQKGRITMEDGGVKIVEPIINALNTTAASYSDYDTISLTAQTGITAAEYNWKQFAASIAISGIEEAKNSGDSAILKLLEARVMQAEETIKEKLDQMCFLDGTGNGGKDFLGLAAIVAATGTLGNIDPTVDTYWKSTVDSTATALTQALMTTLYNTISVGNDHPDQIITTQTLFEKYEGLLAPSLRYTDTDTADAGFQNLLFKAAPITFDTYCQSGTMYMLNSKYLGITGHSDRWFDQTPFVRPENMDARYSLITCYGNMTCRNRARLGKLTAKT